MALTLKIRLLCVVIVLLMLVHPVDMADTGN